MVDDIVAQVVQSFHGAIEQRVDAFAGEIKRAISAPLNVSRGSTDYQLASASSTAPRAD
jgi:hypothetical protein